MYREKAFYFGCKYHWHHLVCSFCVLVDESMKSLTLRYLKPLKLGTYVIQYR
jgi:hypothetical protein